MSAPGQPSVSKARSYKSARAPKRGPKSAAVSRVSAGGANVSWTAPTGASSFLVRVVKTSSGLTSTFEAQSSPFFIPAYAVRKHAAYVVTVAAVYSQTDTVWGLNVSVSAAATDNVFDLTLASNTIVDGKRRINVGPGLRRYPDDPPACNQTKGYVGVMDGGQISVYAETSDTDVPAGVSRSVAGPLEVEFSKLYICTPAEWEVNKAAWNAALPYGVPALTTQPDAYKQLFAALTGYGWTVEFWVRVVDALGENGGFTLFRISKSEWSRSLALTASAGGVFSLVVDGTKYVSESTASPTNKSQWNKIAITFDGDSVSLFVNGTKIGATAGNSDQPFFPELGAIGVVWPPPAEGQYNINDTVSYAGTLNFGRAASGAAPAVETQFAGIKIFSGVVYL